MNKLNIDQYQSNLIEVRESANKGLGIFAISKIPRGTRVISEPALLEVTHGEATNAKDIVRAFEQLTPSQQERFLELHGYACDSFKQAAGCEMEQTWQEISELHRKVLSIYAANAFGSVFLLGSRINHSCLPNIHFAYNPKLKRETFHAIRNITPGEELTIMYINGTNRTMSQRKAELEKWGFACSCPACEDTPRGNQRERKRAELFELDQKLAMYAQLDIERSYREALQTALRMAAIQQSEGLVNRDLGVSYHDAARYCLKLGRSKMALMWAKKELEVDLYCVGEDHPDSVKEVKVVEGLRAAAEKSVPVDECVTDWFSLQGGSMESCVIM